jgi:hypothetical protein
MNVIFSAILGALCTAGGFMAGYYSRLYEERKYGRR